MARPEDEPQDIIKFYNQIYIPAMKDHLLRVCTPANYGGAAPAEGAATGATSRGCCSPGMRGIGSSPQRVSSKADVYVSQPRRGNDPSMTPRTRTLYAFTDTPAHTSSDGLKHINHQLNAASSGGNDAANTLTALSSMSPPAVPSASAVSGMGKRAASAEFDLGGEGRRHVMKRRIDELAMDRNSTSPASSISEPMAEDK